MSLENEIKELRESVDMLTAAILGADVPSSGENIPGGGSQISSRLFAPAAADTRHT